MKILLIKMSSMGDVVHTMPVLTDILQHCPDAHVDWVVEQGFADLVRANAPLVRRVLPIRLRAWRKKWREPQSHQEWRAFKETLQAETYDVVIDCQGLLKSAFVSRMAKLTVNGRRVGFDRRSIRESLASYFYNDTYVVSRQLPAVIRNRQLCAQALNYSIDGETPQVSLPSLAQYAAPRDDWQNPSESYAVLIPNASRVEKRWPAADWHAVAAQCHAAGLRTVWFWGGVDELMYTQELLAGLPHEVFTQALLPPFLTIPQAALCIEKAQCVIGLDSGLTHLAAALGRPTLGIYCDHDADLAPMTAHGQDDALVVSLGGVGNPPSLASVQAVLHRWLVV